MDGIDRAAINKLNELQLDVIGVISGGLNYEYTSSSVTKELAHNILERGGLLLSEVEPNAKEDRYSGSKASRIQAGLSSALILIQSSIGGGSKYTLKTFVKLNRTLGVVSLKNHIEFMGDELFSANRLITDHGIQGLAEFCEMKTTKNVLVKKMVLLSNRDDYVKIDTTTQFRTLLFQE